jgi:hypothetical protein
LIVLVALVLATLSAALPARVAALVLGAMAAVLGVIAVQSVRVQDRRPDYRDAAAYLDRVAGSDPVVEVPLLLSPDARLGSSALDLYDRRPHRLSRFLDPTPWLKARAGGHGVYLVDPQDPALRAAVGLDRAPAALLARRAQLGGLDGRAIARTTKTFAGFYPIVVRRYSGAAQGRVVRRGTEQVISWTFGRRIVVTPGAARGAVESAKRAGTQIAIVGYALAPTGARPADWALAFSGGRLFAVSSLGGKRPDLARALGPSAGLAGFTLPSLGAPPDPSDLHVYAVSGTRASELPLSPAAKRALGS